MPGYGKSPAVSFSTTEKSSSVSGASSHQEYWACQAKIPRGYWCSPRSSRIGTSTSLPKRWCSAACELCWGSGDCRCGSRWKMSILSVSHVLGRGHIEREFHKELMPNCLESCVVSWKLFIKSGRRLRRGRARGGEAEPEVPLRTAVRDGDVLLADEREANKAWCVDWQELFLRLTSQLLKDKHTWTFRPGLWERDVCTLLLTKSILGLPGWIRAGYQGSGDIRPACMLRLVKSKSFLDSVVRRCCKDGHSCMRKVIDCSSVPHKMAWRSVAQAIRAVSRLGGPGCENF